MKSALWANRNYRFLMAGQTVSVIGNQLTTFAFFLVVLDITGSPTQASAAAALFVLSMVTFGLPIGRVVDRFSRLAVLRLAAIAGIAGSLLSFAATFGGPQITLFCTSAVILGAVASAFGTAERALLKEIVEPDLLAQAMAVNQGRYSIGVLIGPPVAGILLTVSPRAPFVFDALTFVWVLGCLMLIRHQSTVVGEQQETPPMRPAWDWLVGQKQLFAIGWFSPLMNFSFAGITTLALLALKFEQFDSVSLGLYQAGIGLAGILGAFIAGRLVQSFSAGPLILVSLAFFVCGLAATLGNPWWVMGGMIFAGLALPVFNTPCSGHFIKLVPDSLQGRCTAILSTSAMVTMPIGNSLAGVLFEHVGKQWSIGLFVMSIVVSSLAFAGVGDIGKVRI